jgi:hypothetical protein
MERRTGQHHAFYLLGWPGDPYGFGKRIEGDDIHFWTRALKGGAILVSV